MDQTHLFHNVDPFQKYELVFNIDKIRNEIDSMLTNANNRAGKEEYTKFLCHIRQQTNIIYESKFAES